MGVVRRFGEHVVLKIDVQGAAAVRERLSDALFIFRHERRMGGVDAVRARIDVPEELAVAIEMRRVGARIAGRQANVVNCVQVARAIWADLNHD